MYELFVLACLMHQPNMCVTLRDLYSPHETHDKCLSRAYEIAKGMPIHVKSAYFYNLLLDKLNTKNKYEAIGTGDKVRYMYIEQPNKFGLESIGFKYDYPKEFSDLFKPDYDKMFEKILFQAIERFYDNVGWKIRKPSENVTVELFDLFSK